MFNLGIKIKIIPCGGKTNDKIVEPAFVDQIE